MPNQQNLVKEINSFAKRYEDKIDKNYVLFLFQIYNYSEGIQEVCESLNMMQGLLSYYIQKNDFKNVLNVCTKHGAQNLDLWIQALTYFRDLEGQDEIVEEYL